MGEKDTRQRRCSSVIIAMGSKANFLGIPGENTYWGRGFPIARCAMDLSIEENVLGSRERGMRLTRSLYLSNIAKEVTVFVRKDAFKGIEEKRIKALAAKPNVKVRFLSEVNEVKG